MLKGILTLTLVSAMTVGACAGDLLKGVTKFDLSIIELNSDAHSCGLSEMQIKRDFMGAISGTGIVIEAGARPAITVSVDVVHTAKGCAASLLMQVGQYGWVTFDVMRMPDPQHPLEGLKFTNVALWDDNWLGLSDALDHPFVVSRAIDEMAGRFVSDWKEQNKSSD